MDTLRSISARSGAVSGEKNISMFHKFFLSLTKYTGRTWEPGFSLYELRSGGLGGFMGWGMKAFLKGRLGIFPSFKGGKEFRRLFNQLGKGGVR
jgi:hypothetical protein